MNKDDEEAAETLAGCSLILVVWPLSYLLQGYSISIVWGWHLSELVGFDLPVPQAIAICMVFSAINSSMNVVYAQTLQIRKILGAEEAILNTGTRALMYALIQPVITLTGGWVLFILGMM